MPLEKALDQIQEVDLQALLSNQVSEQKTLEYKQSLPGNSDSDRKEFLADASSFANATGGHLIYGMSAKSGLPIDLCGLDTDADAAVSALESSIRLGVDPRIPNVHSWPVKLKNRKKVIVVRIPKSFAAPHMVTYKGTSRFYSRTSNGKYQLNVAEIRDAFLLSETAAEKARDFRAERLGKIVANETPIYLGDGAKVVLHLVPLGRLRQPVQLDSDVVDDVLRKGLLFPTYRTGLNACRYNFDGVFTYTHPSSAPLATAYLQVFRSGSIETADGCLLQRSKRIPSIAFEEGILERLPRYFEALKMLDINAPVFNTLSLLGVLGFTMAVSGPVDDACTEIDRENLICPEILVEDFNCAADGIMKPVFDAVWNATGWPESPHYQGGKWTKPR